MAETETTYSVNLVVEDGRGIPNANSYVSLAYCDEYMVNRNYSAWVEQSEYVRSAAIIKAMDYVDNIFLWKGTRMHKNQSLHFPRKDIQDEDGFDYTGEIPEQLKKAVCEAAFNVFSQYTLYARKSTDGAIKKEKKKADVVEIEKEYFSNEEVKVDWTSAYESLDTMLRGLFRQKGQGSIIKRVHWDY